MKNCSCADCVCTDDSNCIPCAAALVVTVIESYKMTRPKK